MKIGHSLSQCIRLVSFDFTNTLATFSFSAGEQYSKALAKKGVNCPPDVLEQSFYKKYIPFAKEIPFYGRNHGMSCEDWWEDLFHQTLRDAMQDDYNKTEIKVFNNVFIDLYFHFEMEPVPHAKEVLSKLRLLKTKRNEPMLTIIITNNDIRCIDTIEKFQWSSYFDYIDIPATYGKAKPDPSVFWDALKFTEKAKNLKEAILPEQCLHIGNNFKNDYIAAKEAGFNALLVNCEDATCKHNITHINDGMATCGHDISEEHCCHDLLEVYQCVNKLNS